MSSKVKLTPKTKKGKDRLVQVQDALTIFDIKWGGGWTVFKTNDVVFFSNKPGPWLYVEPTVHVGVSHRLQAKLIHLGRWVHNSEDDNFTVSPLQG